MHAITIGLTSRALNAAFGEDVWVRPQLPLRIGNFSEPDPDISVVNGGPRDYMETDHPASALLVIEVSDTTLGFDRNRKASLYASGAIGEYWIINLIAKQLEVHRKPMSDESAAFAHRYADITTLTAGATISPLAAPD